MVAAGVDRWRIPVQTGVAAGVSWAAAIYLAHHTAPLTAPAIACIAIGATTSGRARRVLDMIIGLTIGVALATLLGAAFGQDAVFLAVIVTAAMVTASAVPGGDILAMQAGIAAILVFASANDGSVTAALERVLDALIGSGAAVAVSLFVLPPNPVALLGTRFHALHTELGAVLDEVADGLRRRDDERIAAALQRARATATEVEALHAVRPVAAEIARFVPVHRATRGRVAYLDERADALDHVSRNVRVIARCAVITVGADDGAQDECASAIANLAEAARRSDPTGADTQPLARLARRATDRLDALYAAHPSSNLGAIAAASRGIADDLDP